MTPDEFRQAGHQLIDWIADYRNEVDSRPVAAQVPPGWVRDRLADAPPEQPDSIDDVIADLDTVVLPGMTHWQHPSFFAWFPSNATLSSVLGDLTAAGLGGLGLSWESGPALTEMEEQVCAWFAECLGLDRPWQGSIQDTASTGGFLAMLAAREHATGMAMHTTGIGGHDKELVVYTGATANSSVQRAVAAAGIGLERLRHVPTTADHGVDPDALATMIAEDRAAGLQPAAIVATIGTTGVTAIDPIPALADLATTEGMWLHVDAAMAGAAAILPECAPMFAGVERADSIALNPHKWLGTVFDCSLLFVKEPTRLTGVMSIDPSYIPSANRSIGDADDADGETGTVEPTQYRDWAVPLGRRFRSMKLWMQLRLDGMEATRARLRRDMENARWLATQVDATAHWEVVAPVRLQTVCVRHRPADRDGALLRGSALDDHTSAWVRQLNESGRALVTQDRLGDEAMVRLSIGAEQTERSHVEQLWNDLQRVAASGEHG